MAAMKKIEMTIDGMHCEACVAKIRDALDTVDGVQNSDVQVGSATVTFDFTAHYRRRSIKPCRNRSNRMSGDDTA